MDHAHVHLHPSRRVHSALWQGRKAEVAQPLVAGVETYTSYYAGQRRRGPPFPVRNRHTRRVGAYRRLPQRAGGALYCLGAPKASGMRSIVNLRCEMYMIGTPGILRMRRLRSLSHVATM